MLRRAAALDATPATTRKDAVRLPPAVCDAVLVVGVSLAWDDADAVEAILGGLP